MWIARISPWFLEFPVGSLEEERQMKAFAALCGTAMIALMVTACNQAPPNTHDADVKALNDTEARWNADYESKDPEKVAAYYADDAVLMGPGMPASTGKDAIRTTIKQMLTAPALSLKFRPSRVDVDKSGELGYTQGSYTMVMTNPATKRAINDHGTYVTVYRKQADGKWRAVADIATSEMPPSAPASARGKSHSPAKKHAAVKRHSLARKH